MVEPTQIVPIVTNLGVAGFAIWIIWKVSQAFLTRLKEKDLESAQERAVLREAENIRIENMRKLEKEVRENITAQLIENTKAHHSTAVVLERVITHLDRK